MTLKQWLSFITVSLVWGSSFLWIKLVVQEIGPFTLVAWRLLFGGVFLVFVIWWQKPEFPRKASLWWALAFFGLINTAVPFVLISWGEQYIDSAVASILNGAVPLFTMFIAHVFLSDDRITLFRTVGLMVGFAGIVVLMSQSVQEGGFGGDAFWGSLALIGASLGYACGVVFARRKLSGVRPMVQAFVAVAFADAVIWAGTLWLESPLTLPLLPVTWVGLLILGLLGTGLAYLLFFQLIQTIGPTRSTMVTYVAPLVGVILGVTFLSEPLTWNLIAGTILIVSAVLLVNRRQVAAVVRAQQKTP